MIQKIVLSWVVLGVLLWAQTIQKINFEGLSYLSPSVAMNIAGVHKGDNLSSEKIDQSIKNLFKEGYFSDISVTQNGGTLTYHLKEKIAIANIAIQGDVADEDAKQLLAVSGLKKGSLYDAWHIEKAKKAILANLESRGNYDSVLKVETTPVGKGAVSVVFVINKGEKIKVKKINFIGASALSKSDLEANLVNQEADLLGWLPLLHSGEVKVNQLEYDAYRLKETYMQHGYLDAQISKPLMRIDYSAHSAEIDYQIHEGVQYRVGTMQIVQNIPGLSTAKLQEKLTLKKGRVFNILNMRKDMKMIQTEAGNLGYAYAKVIPQMNKDAQNKLLNLQYIVRSGDKVTINDVLISGNTTTKDRVIRRYIYLAPGDTFSAQDLKDSKSALGRTGFFEKVDIQSQQVSADKINLLVKVKEASTGTISAGGGYGSYEGLMLNASVSDKNIFGSGINASVGFDISKISTNYNLSFVNPRVWDSLYSFSLSLYKKEYEYIDYTQDQLGATMNFGRQFTRHVYASMGVGYVDNQSSMNEDSNISAEDYFLYTDKYQKTSLFATIKFDNTDDYYTPREGMIASLSVEYASLDGDDVNTSVYPKGYGTFTKVSGKFGLYYGLDDWLDYDLILRFKARGTLISKNDGEKLPVAERLFMGGVGSVRGYDAYSISPLLPSGDRIGGTKRFSTSLEASVPLSEAAKMRLTFFYDYGVLGSDDEPFNDTTLTFDDMHRSSAGAVIEWQSGFGPIDLVFAKALDEKEGDRTSTFEFSMGSKF